MTVHKENFVRQRQNKSYVISNSKKTKYNIIHQEIMSSTWDTIQSQITRFSKKKILLKLHLFPIIRKPWPCQIDVTIKKGSKAPQYKDQSSPHLYN